MGETEEENYLISGVIIYTHSLTPRLRYVLDFISEFYQTSFRLVYDEEAYIAMEDPHKINYSYHRLLPNEVWIHSHVLLFETTVRPVKVECFQQHGYTAFFKAEGDVGFDLFAAVFYLLTRYEEYLPHQKDAYGRYAHHNSLAYKEGFLQQPLIHLWLHQFKNLLQQKFTGIELQAPGFGLQLTYDIDMAWSFRNKGVQRNAGAMTLLFLKGRWRSLFYRVKVVRGKLPDPYDAYEWMDNLHAKYNLHPVYFFLVAAQVGRLDKNTNPKNASFQQLIKSTADRYQTGLHPSWASGDLTPLLTEEKRRLEKITGHPITASRQHYIRLNLPATYQRLLQCGFTQDYSMGYGSINGFRASVAVPFFWYDLKNDEATALRIHPFCFMDANSYYEELKTATEAQKELEAYGEILHTYGGTLSMIWHNSFLGTHPDFEGWRSVYENFVQSYSKQ